MRNRLEFERANPQLRRLQDATPREKDLLLWAQSKKILTLTKWRKIVYYTQWEASQAALWAEKMNYTPQEE